MAKPIQQQLLLAKKQQLKKFAVLIDPDKIDQTSIKIIAERAEQAAVDYFFVGGSLVSNNESAYWIGELKRQTSIPVIIFPGSTLQVNDKADAIFFLSLISGRNPELLIGKQVVAAPILKKMDIEVISTGYMIVDGGRPTTVSYVTGTFPIPYDKPQIALSTALAGEMMGMSVIYMDSGSGAERAISTEMIEAVSQGIDIPLVIGGGINTPEKAYDVCRAGADVVVVGTAIERDPLLIQEISKAVHHKSLTLV